MKHLLLSYATNVGLEELSRFVSSARRHLPSSSTDIVLFSNMPAEHASALRPLDVQVIPEHTLWKAVQASPVSRLLFRCMFLVVETLAGSTGGGRSFKEVETAMCRLWAHPILARHVAYLEFLRMHGQDRLVMLSDARDVVFQGDPFLHLDRGCIHAFLQDPSILYGGRNIDAEWLTGTIGSSRAATLDGQRVACAGTIIGGASVLTSFLEDLVAEVLQHKRGGIDQALYNMLLRSEKWASRTLLHENLVSAVLTFGGVDSGAYAVKDARVTVGDHVPAVLHQYDRDAKVLSALASTGAACAPADAARHPQRDQREPHAVP